MDIYTIWGICFLIILFALNIVFLFLGYKYGSRSKLTNSSTEKNGMQLIEGSVFALLGLLLAFTFSGAVDKFDKRRALIIDEANAISTLYLRYDLFPDENKSLFKKDVRTYLDLRIKTYRAFPDIGAAEHYLSDSLKYQNKLWRETTGLCALIKSTVPCMLVLPALNQAFDIENTRVSETHMHPPMYIFILLICVALIAAFFIGNNVENPKSVNIVYIVFYTFTISLVIFSIIDMEYPRLGFIRINSFDRVLIDLQTALNADVSS